MCDDPCPGRCPSSQDRFGTGRTVQKTTEDAPLHAVMPLIRRLVRRAFARLAPDVDVSSLLDVLLALVGELEWPADESDEDGSPDDEELCST